MQINAAIQLLPLGAKGSRYEVVDKAIVLIQKSGLNYKVCPFETVVEGQPDAVYKLIRDIQDTIISEDCT